MYSSSGDLYEYLTKGRVDPKDKRAAKGKKVATLEETPIWSPRRNNSNASPLYSPPPLEAEDNAESISKEASSENANSMEDVDVPLIDVQHSPLALTPTLVPTDE